MKLVKDSYNYIDVVRGCEKTRYFSSDFTSVLCYQKNNIVFVSKQNYLHFWHFLTKIGVLLINKTLVTLQAVKSRDQTPLVR